MPHLKQTECMQRPQAGVFAHLCVKAALDQRTSVGTSQKSQENLSCLFSHDITIFLETGR